MLGIQFAQRCIVEMRRSHSIRAPKYTYVGPILMNHGGNAINEAIQFGGNLEKGLRTIVPFRCVRGGERERESGWQRGERIENKRSLKRVRGVRERERAFTLRLSRVLWSRTVAPRALENEHTEKPVLPLLPVFCFFRLSWTRDADSCSRSRCTSTCFVMKSGVRANAAAAAFSRP
jgi:hypothetical protein